MSYTLKFKIRLDRTKADGRTPVFADMYWSLGARGAGFARVNGIVTGVECKPENWMDERRKKALAEGKRPLSSERLIYTAEVNSLALNMRLDRIKAAMSTLFTRCATDNLIPTPEQVRAVVTNAKPKISAEHSLALEYGFVPTPESSMHELVAYWRELNEGLLAKKTLTKYNSIPERLDAFAKGITCRHITREWTMRYTAHLYESGMHDAGVQTVFKWFREAFRLVGLPVPRYLTNVTFRTGSKPVLLASEFKALMGLDLKREPELEAERDVFVFQTLMLLRDVDMKDLAPHRAVPVTLAAPWGDVLGLRLTQNKTDIDVLGVMPPAAATIWKRYKGALPMCSNQERNRRIKEVATRAKLNRDVVLTKFAGPKRYEEVVPLRRVIASHMARHSGATFVLQGSNGNRDLKEIALGHANDVYAPGDIYLYGPQLLAAWQAVFGQ